MRCSAVQLLLNFNAMPADDAVAVSATFHSPQGGLRVASLHRSFATKALLL